MANTKGRYTEETKQDRTKGMRPIQANSKAFGADMEDVDLHSSDEYEFEDIGFGEDEEGRNGYDFEFIDNEVQVSRLHHPCPWKELIDTKYQTPGGNRTIIPAESFRGTWEGAYQETARALSDVKDASQVYISAIANSNITRAGLAISGAIATTANRSAFLMVNKTLEASGQDESKLPRKFMDWIKTKRNIDEAKQKAATAKKERKESRVLAAAIAEGKVTEVLPSSRQSCMSSRAAVDILSYGFDTMNDTDIQYMRDINARAPPTFRARGRQGTGKLPSYPLVDEQEDIKTLQAKISTDSDNTWGGNVPGTPSSPRPFESIIERSPYLP